MAATPSRVISGIAQWWPARRHTWSRSAIVARSCGWMPVEREGDDAGAARGWRAVQGQPLDVAQRLVGVLGDLALVRPDRVHAEAAQVVDGGAQADDLGDRLRAGLELPRQVVIGGAFDRGPS